MIFGHPTESRHRWRPVALICALGGLLSLPLAGWTNEPTVVRELLRVDYEPRLMTHHDGVKAERPEAVDAIEVDCTVAREGRCSLRTLLRRDPRYVSFGNYRAESDTTEVQATRYSAGEWRRYGFSLRTAPDWEADDREAVDIVWQFKRFSSPPDMFVGIKGQDLVLRAPPDLQFVLIKGSPTGRWIDVQLDVRWSTGSEGEVVARVREEGGNDFREAARFTGPNMRDGRARNASLKWGLYKPGYEKSQRAPNRVLWHDNVYVQQLQ